MKPTALTLTLLLALSGCVADTGYTLYRTNVDAGAKKETPVRLYVATFDVPRSESADQMLLNYNSANCKFAEKLFNEDQPHLKGSAFEHIRIFYWCEKGGYRP